MSKTKSTAIKGIADTEATFAFGAEALNSGFEKTAKFFTVASEFGKDTAEAYAESASIAGKGIQALSSEVYSYSKQSAADSIETAKAIMASKSVHEAFALQTEFVQSLFKGYFSQLNKFNEQFTTTAKDSFAPLKGRAVAFAEAVQGAAV